MGPDLAFYNLQTKRRILSVYIEYIIKINKGVITAKFPRDKGDV